MSFAEFTSVGYLLSYNNGLAYQWFDDKDSAHIRAGNLDLESYTVTEYRAVSHQLFSRGGQLMGASTDV